MHSFCEKINIKNYDIGNTYIISCSESITAQFNDTYNKANLTLYQYGANHRRK